MSLGRLRSTWAKLQGGASFGQRRAYLDELVSHTEPEAVAFHFDLLRHRDDIDFYQDARAAFVRRGSAVESFLSERADHDADGPARADALQLLGHLRSTRAAPLCRAWLKQDDASLRQSAIIVLGWVGSAADVPLLVERLRCDPSARLRGFAATALRQIWLTHPDVRQSVLEGLRDALIRESDPEALRGQLLCLQTVTKRRFGLKERLSEGIVVGDVDEAKAKALAHLRAK